MVADAPERHRPHARRLYLLALVLLLVATTVTSLDVARDNRAAAGRALAKAGFAIGEDIPASFGAVAVEIVQKIGGPTNGQLTGASHGINGLVEPSQELVEVTAVMTNQRKTTQSYTPDLWRLRAGPTGRPMAAEHANIGAGVLQPAASIELRLRFVVPRRGEQLWAEFSDPGRVAPIVVDLGRTSETPYGTDTSHRH